MVMQVQARQPLTGVDAMTALIRRATTRDQGAFGDLYQMYIDKVYRHIYYMVGRKEEAEDITAQTFLQAWQAIERFRPGDASFLAWLLRIAHNLAISRFRSRRDYLPLEDGWGWGIADSRSSPDKLYEIKDDSERLRQAIMRLKGIYRQVVVLRFIDDLDYEQVACILGRSVAAVRVIQHRALVNLRRMMEEADDI